MTELDRQLAEWKERSESYRLYRTQYINVLSVTGSVCVVLTAVAASDKNSFGTRAVILTVICLCLSTLIIAHRFARKEFRRLGERLNKLEAQLGFEEFFPTRALEEAVAVTEKVTVIGLIIAIFLLISPLVTT